MLYIVRLFKCSLNTYSDIDGTKTVTNIAWYHSFNTVQFTLNVVLWTAVIWIILYRYGFLRLRYSILLESWEFDKLAEIYPKVVTEVQKWMSYSVWNIFFFSVCWIPLFSLTFCVERETYNRTCLKGLILLHSHPKTLVVAYFDPPKTSHRFLKRNHSYNATF